MDRAIDSTLFPTWLLLLLLLLLRSLLLLLLLAAGFAVVALDFPGARQLLHNWAKQWGIYLAAYPADCEWVEL